MENNKVNVIYFSTNHDSIGLRFLSNNSVYPFVLDNKRWPTVTHYIYAKRFEGTRLEDEIREAPTIFQAKKLATKYKYVTEIDPVTEKEIKCKGYGKNHSYRIREDWRENEERHMKNAISAIPAYNSILLCLEAGFILILEIKKDIEQTNHNTK